MHTLDVRPSKRLIVFYSLLYTLSLISIIVYSQTWPWFIIAIIVASVFCAAVMSLYVLCNLKRIICLPKGQVELQFKKHIKGYDEITICHRGPRLIILHCKNARKQRYVLCLADAFSAEDFGLLQRLLKQQEWVK